MVPDSAPKSIQTNSHEEKNTQNKQVNQTQSSTIVKLNIGGHKFMTSMETLESHGENYLTVLAKQEKDSLIQACKDDDGYIFIDRDGFYFRPIIEFLRYGTLSVDCEKYDVDKLNREIDFYCVKMPKLERAFLSVETIEIKTRTHCIVERIGERNISDEVINLLELEDEETRKKNLTQIEKTLESLILQQKPYLKNQQYLESKRYQEHNTKISQYKKWKKIYESFDGTRGNTLKNFDEVCVLLLNDGWKIVNGMSKYPIRCVFQKIVEKKKKPLKVEISSDSEEDFTDTLDEP